MGFQEYGKAGKKRFSAYFGLVVNSMQASISLGRNRCEPRHVGMYVRSLLLSFFVDHLYFLPKM